MTSNRPPHIEASSTIPTGGDNGKPRARNLSADQSDSAATKKTALSDLSDKLMEQIVDEQNVEKAWRKVKANKGAPGPDGITLDDFPQSYRAQWPAIRQQLLDGTYAPQPARRKSIPKSDGSERKLGIPNVMERLIQQCILQVLTPIFDPHFSESSFGFRPKRSAHGAVKQVQTHIRSGYRHCVDMDLSKFFDRVQHDVLLARVARKVGDKRLLRLIGNYLRAGVMVDASWEPSHEGTMQGGPLSPLLANILLDDFDKELERRGLHFVRYADDFLVFTKTEKSALRVFASVERYLTRKLKLVVIRLVDHLRIKKFHIVGYSMGAAVAGKILVDHPDRLLSVTFGGGGPLFRQPSALIAARDQTATSLEQGKGIGPLLIALTPEGQPLPSLEQATAISMRALGDKDQKALAAVLRTQTELEVTEEQLKANSVPVLFVFGSRDTIFKELVAELQKVLPKTVASVVEVEKGDHMSTAADPHFRKAVLRFLREHAE